MHSVAALSDATVAHNQQRTNVHECASRRRPPMLASTRSRAHMSDLETSMPTISH